VGSLWWISVKKGGFVINKDIKMYILVNEDIKISKGKLAVQVGHAVATYFYKIFLGLGLGMGSTTQSIKDYMNGYQKKIILYCPQSKLEKLEELGYITIRDAGFTELEPDTLTCVCLGLRDDDNFITGELQFVKDLKLV